MVGYQCLFISESTIATEKYTFSVFPIEKSKGQNLTLHKIGQGHSRVICNSRVQNTTYKVSVVLKKRIKVFTIYGYGSHLGLMTWAKYINFHSPFAWRLGMKDLIKIGLVVSEEKPFENVE